jgi:hypothetical protein
VITEFIRRMVVRMRLLGMVPRFAKVHPEDLDDVGEIGALCLEADPRVPRGKAWVME